MIVPVSFWRFWYFDFLRRDKKWVAAMVNRKGQLDLSRLRSEALDLLWVAHLAHKKFKKEITVTSTYDKAPNRKEGSMHYLNLAFDTRVWALTGGQARELKRYADDLLKVKLGIPYCDIVVYNNHIHWEVDKKKLEKFKDQ